MDSAVAQESPASTWPMRAKIPTIVLRLALSALFLAGGAFVTLLNARADALPRPGMGWYYDTARSRDLSERRRDGRADATPYEIFSQRGWTVALYRRESDGETYMVRSWAGTEAPRAEVVVPSWSRASGPPTSDPRCSIALNELPYGWPMHSMVAEVASGLVKPQPGRGADATIVCGIATPTNRSALVASHWLAWPWFSDGFMADSRSIDDWRSAPTWFGAPPPPIFPTRMIPLGFVINSVFYATVIAAAIVGLRISARETRSLIRSRRGECRACGHPLAGLPRCPECGAEVPRPARA